MKVTLEIEDTPEGKSLLEFLKTLSCVKIMTSQKRTDTSHFVKAYGIWQKRQITKDMLRQKAWGL